MISGRQLERVHPGDLFRPQKYNDVVDEVVRLGQTSVSGPVEAFNTSAGQTFTPIRRERIYAIITGLIGKAYSWNEVYPAAGGTFTTGSRSGMASNDPAFEANGLLVSSSPFLPLITTISRPPSSLHWIFFADMCPCSPTPTPTPTPTPSP
jgi:hypothetical protein